MLDQVLTHFPQKKRPSASLSENHDGHDLSDKVDLRLDIITNK